MKKLLFCTLSIFTLGLFGCSKEQPRSTYEHRELSYISFVEITDSSQKKICSVSGSTDDVVTLTSATDYYLTVYAGPGSACLGCKNIAFECDSEIIAFSETESGTMFKFQGLTQCNNYEVTLKANFPSTGKTDELRLYFRFV